jgi:hypothetical protein
MMDEAKAAEMRRGLAQTARILATGVREQIAEARRDDPIDPAKLALLAEDQRAVLALQRELAGPGA